MNSEQLETWLTEFSERTLPCARRSTSTSPPIASNGTSKAAPASVDGTSASEHRRQLSKEAENAQLLIQYIICNYEQTERIHPLIGQLLAIYYRFGAFAFVVNL